MRQITVAFTLVFAVSGIFLVLTTQPQQQKKPPQKAEAKKPSVPVKNEGWRITYGDPKAKVKVEAFYPIGSGGHEFVLEFSRKLAEAFPGKVQVVIYDWTKPKGADEFSKRGLSCGCFIINGKMQVAHKGKTVAFLRRPEMMGWNFDLLKAVVAEEVNKVYGKGTKPEQKKPAPVQKTSTRTSSNPKVVVEIFVP